MATNNQRDFVRDNMDTVVLNLLEKGDKYGTDIIKEIDNRTSGQYKIKSATINSVMRKLEESGFVTIKSTDINGNRKRLFSITEMGRSACVRNMAAYEYERTKTDRLLSDKATNLSVLPPVLSLKKAKKPKKTMNDQGDQLIQLELEANPAFAYVNDLTEDIVNPLDQEQNIPSTTIINNQYVFNNTVNNTSETQHFSNEINHNKQGQEELYIQDVPTELDKQPKTPVILDVDSNTILQNIYDSNQNQVSSYIDNQQNIELESVSEDTQPFEYDNVYDNQYLEEQLIQPQEEFSEPTIAPLAFTSIISNQQLERNNLLDREYKQALQALLKPFVPNIIVKKKQPPIITKEKPIQRTVVKMVEKPVVQDIPSTQEQYPSTQQQTSVNHFMTQEPNFTTTETTTFLNSNQQNPKTQELYDITKQFVNTPNNYYDNPTVPQNIISTDARMAQYTSNNMPASYTEKLPTVRAYDAKPKIEQSKNNYYQYKLMSTQYLILFMFMALEIIFTFSIVKIVLSYSQAYDWMMYTIAFIVALSFPVYSRIKLYNNREKTKRYTSDYKWNLLFSIGIFMAIAITTFLIHLIVDADFAIMGNIATSLFLPIILSTNIPINCIIYNYLYKTEKYSVLL